MRSRQLIAPQERGHQHPPGLVAHAEPDGRADSPRLLSELLSRGQVPSASGVGALRSGASGLGSDSGPWNIRGEVVGSVRYGVSPT